MTINEKIHKIRVKKSMSRAELAFKTGLTINEVISLETNGTILKGFTLLQILNAFSVTIDEFEKIH